MDKPRIEIQTLGGVFAKVLVDVNEIEDVTGYRVEHRAGELPPSLFRDESNKYDYQ